LRAVACYGNRVLLFLHDDGTVVAFHLRLNDKRVVVAAAAAAPRLGHRGHEADFTMRVHQTAGLVLITGKSEPLQEGDRRNEAMLVDMAPWPPRLVPGSLAVDVGLLAQGGRFRPPVYKPSFVLSRHVAAAIQVCMIRS
jgi:hypothetical protein